MTSAFVFILRSETSLVWKNRYWKSGKTDICIHKKPCSYSIAKHVKTDHYRLMIQREPENKKRRWSCNHNRKIRYFIQAKKEQVFTALQDSELKYHKKLHWISTFVQDNRFQITTKQPETKIPYKLKTGEIQELSNFSSFSR